MATELAALKLSVEITTLSLAMNTSPLTFSGNQATNECQPHKPSLLLAYNGKARPLSFAEFVKYHADF
jgi:hypothetical protein